MTDPSAPGGAWYQDAVFYEVAVKAFLDSNHDGVGDFRGLTSRLDYIAELGATCVWLLPFFPSPLRDDGYDVSDYRGVHPRFGSMDDFEEFILAAHGHGLKVAAEMVVNHTSVDHPWFQAARQAPAGSALRDFYLWRKGPGDAGEGAGWTWDSVAGASYWHHFSSHQPDLNYNNPLVRAEMLRVLRFWLDRGIDGLCLNGASFLVEHEGAARENLPETHSVLKEFREHLEREYPGRMIQAGLNQWPGEAATYFGAGRECHMVPHLPLAQRLFQAVRQEDRHPLVEILRQTPEPPTGCQWVTLLRNHDELTLGLATDEERDYLFREYAAGPELRLRQGILRRLAPLLENDRRRIELLFGLLFSLPGAPVVYYGDEIGMGDNAQVRDRDGVRTPMQWSAERNAGFSGADFARLYRAPVMDPVYGYQAVNVEAQRRDPSSLFHSLRRLIGLRRSHPALSRGKLEILEPANRKVFACVRSLGEEVVLAVANLSRSAQPVELDLSAYQGLVLVELFGRTPFPAVSERPYFLTLGPHGFYWFRLQRAAESITSRLAPVEVEERGELPIVEVSQWEKSLEGPALAALERHVLPGFLRSQRWFGGKARSVEGVKLLDAGPLPGSAPAWLVLFEVRLSHGQGHLYQLPLAVSAGPAAAEILKAMPSGVLARLRGPGGEAVLHDALADSGICSTLLDAVAQGAEFRTREGVVSAFATSAFRELRGDGSRPLPVVRGPATSSNSLVRYGRRLLLKLFRRLEAGINPDLEVGRFLTEGGEFERIPRVAGALEYRGPGGERTTLGILQALVAHQGDGWSAAIDELGRYFERVSGRRHGPDPVRPAGLPLLELAEADPPPGALEVIGSYLHTAGVLGRRTAEMHLALADADSRSQNKDFVPEPLGPEDLARLAEETADQAERALAALAENLERLPPSVRPGALGLLERRERIVERLKKPPAVSPGAVKTRVHGDYHLGQVLWVDGDFVILDFEGEPARSVAERRARQSPLKDVAGMLRSFDYAAGAGLFAFTQHRPGDFGPLEPWAQLWQQWTSAAFLREYLARARGAAFLPARREALAGLLDTFLLDKGFYELTYELNNRPDWVRIPLRGVLALVGELGDKP